MGKVVTTTYHRVPVYETKRGAGKDGDGNWVGAEWEEQVGTEIESVEQEHYYCDKCGAFSLQFLWIRPNEPIKSTWKKKSTLVMRGCIVVAAVLLGIVICGGAWIVPKTFGSAIPVSSEEHSIVLMVAMFVWVFATLAAALVAMVLSLVLAAIWRRAEASRHAAQERRNEERYRVLVQTEPYCRCTACGAAYPTANDLSQDNTWGYDPAHLPVR